MLQILPDKYTLHICKALVNEEKATKYLKRRVVVEYYSNEKVQVTSIYFNPFTLRAAKGGLTIFEIFSLQKHFLKTFEG